MTFVIKYTTFRYYLCLDVTFIFYDYRRIFLSEIINLDSEYYF